MKRDWSSIHKDSPEVMAKGAWDYGYLLAAEYWPGLPRETFYAFAADYSLAMTEWADIIGEGKPRQEDVTRFYHDGAGLVFNLLRHPRPPGVWGSEQDRANVTRLGVKAAGARSIVDFGGGIAGMAMQLARWGFQVGYIDAGQTADFGQWWIKREGLDAPPWKPQPGKVATYASLTTAIGGAMSVGPPWHAISAVDVLEHMWDPVGQLRRFYHALAPGGVLVMTRHSFKLHPTHLERTFWLFDQADDVLAGIGFQPLRAPDPHYGIGSWRKKGTLPALPGEEGPETALPSPPADGPGTETDAPVS